MSAVLLRETPIAGVVSATSRSDALYNQLRADIPDIARKLWRKICDFDLGRQRQMLASPTRGFRYATTHIEEMESEYKKYLLLRLLYRNERLPMSKDVDDFWHVHVLSTRSYQCFCEKVGDGYFIHHGPTIDEEENWNLMPAYLSGTLTRYTQYFGEPNSKFWKRQSAKGACCGC